MTQLVKIRKNIDPEDVYVRLFCSETGKSFRKALDGGVTICTCRCAHETFTIYAEPLPGFLKIDIVKEDRWGKEEEVEQFEVEIDES